MMLVESAEIWLDENEVVNTLARAYGVDPDDIRLVRTGFETWDGRQEIRAVVTLKRTEKES